MAEYDDLIAGLTPPDPVTTAVSLLRQFSQNPRPPDPREKELSLAGALMGMTNNDSYAQAGKSLSTYAKEADSRATKEYLAQLALGGKLGVEGLKGATKAYTTDTTNATRLSTAEGRNASREEVARIQGGFGNQRAEISGKYRVQAAQAAPNTYLQLADGSVFQGNKATGGGEIITDPIAREDSIRGSYSNDPVEKGWTNLVNKTAPGFASVRTVLGQSEAIAKRIDRALVIAQQNANKGVVTPQDLTDLAIAQAGVSAGSNGQIAQKLIDEISVKTIGTDFARAKQYLTEHPEDSRAAEWVKRITHILATERQTVRNAVKSSVRPVLEAHADIIRAKGAYGRRYLQNLGFDDEEIADLTGTGADEAPPPRRGGRVLKKAVGGSDPAPAGGETPKPKDRAYWVGRARELKGQKLTPDQIKQKLKEEGFNG